MYAAKRLGVVLIRSARSGFQTRAARLIQLLQYAAIIWLLGLSSETALCATDTPTLVTDTDVAAEGYFVLSWDTAASISRPLLQQSIFPDFTRERESYVVAQSGSMTLTGFPDGKYYFRVGTGGDWSRVLEVTVRHHPLSRALMFFFTGLVLFVSDLMRSANCRIVLFVLLCGVIIHGNRTVGERKD